MLYEIIAPFLAGAAFRCVCRLVADPRGGRPQLLDCKSAAIVASIVPLQRLVVEERARRQTKSHFVMKALSAGGTSRWGPDECHETSCPGSPSLHLSRSS